MSSGIPSVTVQARDCASSSSNDSEIMRGRRLFADGLASESACDSRARLCHQRTTWDRSRAQTDRWVKASTDMTSGGSKGNSNALGILLSSIGLAEGSSGEPDLVRKIGGRVLR